MCVILLEYPVFLMMSVEVCGISKVYNVSMKSDVCGISRVPNVSMMPEVYGISRVSNSLNDVRNVWYFYEYPVF